MCQFTEANNNTQRRDEQVVKTHKNFSKLKWYLVEYMCDGLLNGPIRKLQKTELIPQQFCFAQRITTI